jgi:hypothetical protein
MVDKVRPRLGLWGGCSQDWPSGNAGCGNGLIACIRRHGARRVRPPPCAPVRACAARSFAVCARRGPRQRCRLRQRRDKRSRSVDSRRAPATSRPRTRGARRAAFVFSTPLSRAGARTPRILARQGGMGRSSAMHSTHPPLHLSLSRDRRWCAAEAPCGDGRDFKGSFKDCRLICVSEGRIPCPDGVANPGGGVEGAREDF